VASFGVLGRSIDGAFEGYDPTQAIEMNVMQPNRRFLLDALRSQLRRAHRAAKPGR